MKNAFLLICRILNFGNLVRIPAITLLLFIFISVHLMGAGWSFTAEVHVNGADCGSYSQKIPFPNFGLPTKSDCDNIRQMILNIRVNEGGCVGYYICGPCTGSDILTPGSSSTGSYGDISIDGLLLGKPLFSENSSTIISNWINEYKLKKYSMGLSPEIDLKAGGKALPSTGDDKFDKLYSDQIIGFEKSGYAPVDLSGKSDYIGTTPKLLSTDEDVRKQDEWMKKNGLSGNMQQMSEDNTISADDADARKIQDEQNNAIIKQSNDTYLFAIGNMPGGSLAAEIGGFVNKLTDNTFENLNNGVKAIFGSGSPDAFLNEQQIVVKTVKDVAMDKVKDIAKGSLVTRSSVGGALETGGVISYAQNSIKWIYDFKTIGK